MTYRIIDNRTKENPLPKSRPQAPSTPQRPKGHETPRDRARQAEADLKGQPAKLRSETAQRIYDVLSQYPGYFNQTARETLANGLAEKVSYYVKDSPTNIVKTTIRRDTESAINDPKFPIPLDEKDRIITRIVMAATVISQS